MYLISQRVSSSLFLIRKISPKREIKKKINKLGNFGKFQSPKAREKNSKDHQISILDF
jgi:hypothetical protein